MKEQTIKHPILASAIIFKASKILDELDTVMSFLFLLRNKSLIVGIKYLFNLFVIRNQYQEKINFRQTLILIYLYFNNDK